MNKRKIVLMAAALCMVAILGFGGTLAYLTDTDQATNVFTVGNVEIIQNEQERVKDADGNFTDELKAYEGTKKLFPVVNDSLNKATGYHTGKNYVDKIVTVTVKKTSEPAYVRTHLAIPDVLDNGANKFIASDNIVHWNCGSANDTAPGYNTGIDNDWYWDADLAVDYGGGWNSYEMTYNGVPYTVYVATHKSIVKPGETTSPNLMGVYLDKGVNYNGQTYVDQNKNAFSFPTKDGVPTFEILVLSEAAQAEGFADANAALNAGFGKIGEYCPFEGGTIRVTDAD